MKCNFVLTTLLEMAWEYEDAGIYYGMNLPDWLVRDLDRKRSVRHFVPSIWG